jgi:hypothetical protein
MFVLWTNVHGAAMGGLGTLAIVTAAWIACWPLRRFSPVRSARTAVFVVLIVAVCFATVLVNPYGLELPRTWAAITGSSELRRVLPEHRPFWVVGSWFSLPLLCAFLVALATSRWRDLQATSLASLAWLALGIERTRHLPLLAVAATLVLPDLLRRSRWPALVSGRLGILRAPVAEPRTLAFRWILAAPVAALALAAALHHVAPDPRRAEPRFVRLNVQRWPTDLLPDLVRVRAGLPSGAPILNDMMFGGFLAYFAPELRIAIDDRWELYGDEFMVGYVERLPDWMNRWVVPAEPPLALVRTGRDLDLLLAKDTGWERVSGTATAVLYRRVGRPLPPSPTAIRALTSALPPTRAPASPR